MQDNQENEPKQNEEVKDEKGNDEPQTQNTDSPTPPTTDEVKESLDTPKDNWTGKHRLVTSDEGDRMSRFDDEPKEEVK